jgi:hypothetical protein
MQRASSLAKPVLLQVRLRRAFSRNFRSESPSQDLLLNLEKSYSDTFDSGETYSNFKLESLLDFTETSNEVLMLTTPSNPQFSRTRTFEKIQDALSGKKLVFNLDPSIGLSVDRKFIYLSKMADLKNMNAEFEEDPEMQDLKVMEPLPTNPGFFRNVFNLKFAGETEFEVSTFQNLFREHVRPLTQVEFKDENERALTILQKAKQFIWNEIVPAKQFQFINMNIKMLFEHALINNPPQGTE